MPRTRSAQGDLPPITRDAVLTTAMDLVRRDGIEALSVRRIATELGVWPTTVYHHVGGTKDGLLALTLDAIAGELELPTDDDRPWPDVLEDMARSVRACLAAYPGAAGHLLTASAPGPHAQWLMERMLAVLVERAGLSLVLAHDAYQLVTGHVLTHVEREEHGTAASRAQRYRALADHAELELTARLPAALEKRADDPFLTGLRIVVRGIADTAGSGTARPER
jgi:AcrR family transcriptional regulator